MLQPIVPGRPDGASHAHVPPFVALLVAAARRGEELRSLVEGVARHFGFDAFSYSAWGAPRLDHQPVTYCYATQSDGWMERYDRLRYREADPRVLMTWESPLSFIWNQSLVRGTSERTDAFLDDARAHGIASGIAFMFHGPRDLRILVTFDSAADFNEPLRLHAIARHVPDIVLFGHHFHEIFMRRNLGQAANPWPRDTPLSRRETECVRLAAKGLTTDDIAMKLDIRARTVQYHFDSVRSKLGAANRQEVIAIAVQRNLL